MAAFAVNDHRRFQCDMKVGFIAVGPQERRNAIARVAPAFGAENRFHRIVQSIHLVIAHRVLRGMKRLIRDGDGVIQRGGFAHFSDPVSSSARSSFAYCRRSLSRSASFE